MSRVASLVTMKGIGIVVALALASWWALLGCAETRLEPAARVREQFSVPEAALARRRVPDLYAAAERARDAAIASEQRGDVAAAEDHATRARILLEAAITEARRIGFEERRLAFDRRAQRAEEAARRDDQARASIEAEAARLAASRIAREEMDRALQRGEEDRTRRHVGPPDEGTRAQATVVLLQRARLLVAAAVSLGADDAATARARAGLADADRARNGADKLTAAERALREARLVLGRIRSRTPAPSADTTAALLDAAREAGLRVERLERGVTIAVDAPFAPRTVQRVAALASEYPAGRIRVESRTEAQARRLTDALIGARVDRARVDTGTIGGAVSESGSRIDVVFLAYGVEPPAAAPAP